MLERRVGTVGIPASPCYCPCHHVDVIHSYLIWMVTGPLLCHHVEGDNPASWCFLSFSVRAGRGQERLVEALSLGWGEGALCRAPSSSHCGTLVPEGLVSKVGLSKTRGIATKA